MQRSMICSYSISIEPPRRIEELLLEGGLRRPLLFQKLRGLLRLAQGLGQLAHLFQSAQMEGVDNRIDAGEDVSITFVYRPVNNISMPNQVRGAHNESIWTGTLIQQLGL